MLLFGNDIYISSRCQDGALSGSLLELLETPYNHTDIVRMFVWTEPRCFLVAQSDVLLVEPLFMHADICSD